MKKKPTLEELQAIMNINGGSLDLSGTQITALPDNLTVGDSLYLSSTQITAENVKRLQNRDYVEGKYLYADNILTHIKYTRKKGKYTLYVGKIKGKNVISDGINYAHCGKWKDGISDLNFKAATDRGAEQYKRLTLDSIVNKDDAVAMYRVITGACQQGTKNFLDSLPELKKEYKISEIIELTKGNYGADTFKKFFEECPQCTN